MRVFTLSLLTIVAAGMLGCDTTAPQSDQERAAMHDEAKAAIERMKSVDPGLQKQMDISVGYAILPNIGSAAVGVGGASGTGYVYKNGQRVGTVRLSQASVGVQLGGDTYAELILFQDERALNRMMNNSIEFGGDTSATFVKAGAANDATFAHGVQVYILPKGGLMAGVSLNGQKFEFWSNSDQNQNQNK